MTSNKSSGSPLLIISHFPPPVHGFAVISSAIAEHVSQWRPVTKVNLARPSRITAWKHLRQMSRAIAVSASLLPRRINGAQEISLGVNGGLGLLYNILLLAVARGLGYRTVLHHHTYGYITRHSRLMAVLCALGGAKLEHVFLAHSMARQFQARYGNTKVAHVLENALFVPPTPALDRAPGPLRIGLLSNLSREKGLYDFLATATLLREAGLDAEMYLAGPAGAEDLGAINAAVADGLVHWSGPLYGAEKDAFFAKIDLFLFPTRYVFEAQPTVIYEAMAAGAPVIAFDRGAIKEQVQDCLAVVDQADDFARRALDIIAPLSRDGAPALPEKARALHAETSQKAALSLRQIYGGPSPL